MRAARFLVLAAAIPLSPAAAADLLFGGTAQVRLGYADNPFLDPNAPGGSAQVAGTLAPRLTRTTSLGQTVLSATYDRNQYLSHYSYSDSIAADLRQSERFNERLSGAFHAGYLNSKNPFIGSSLAQPVDPTTGAATPIDELTTGQRTQSYTADTNFSWIPTARDSMTIAGNYTRSTYDSSGRTLASNYSNYGGNASYMRTLGPRSKVGLQVVVNHSDSDAYGSSTSYQPNLVLQWAFTQFWAFNGSVGAIFQNATGQKASHSLGFNGSLCGTYPRDTICFTASRQTAASGIGGLRTDLRFGTNFTYRLTEHSSITGTASYSNSKSKGGTVADQDQKFTQAGVDYSRVVSQRVSVGFGGRYQQRSSQLQGKAHALSGTINLTASFGRTQ